jgi:2-isopropylmalate synthase
MRRIMIFDTTLRDGEQSPGASLNLKEKLQIARQLELLKVDVIEAGFPITSAGDFEAVQAVSESVRGPIICGLARTVVADIERAGQALRKAARPRIHLFCATSEIHRKYKLHKAKPEILRIAAGSVRQAKRHCPDVEFSPEDASRTEPQFLAEVVTAVIEAGATTVNIPDTVGYAMPEHFSELIRHLRKHVPNIHAATISVHCHNDLGLAVANSLAAVLAGADQVECTVNGLGERAGNAALEEIVMAIKTRRDLFQAVTGVATRRLLATSRMVSTLTGMQVQRNKAIVGENAFAHEAGIHQDGVLKERTTYEIMRPEDVGFTMSDLVLGKHSGRAALADRARHLGYNLSGEQLNKVFDGFKVLADKKKQLYDADLAALIEQQIRTVAEHWTLESYDLSSGSGRTPEVTLTVRHGDQVQSTRMAAGDGPIDAVFLAIGKLTGVAVTCKDFHVHSVTVGQDAQGEVTVQVDYRGELYRGRGVSTDSVEASARAFLNAINRIAAVTVPGEKPAASGSTFPS